MTQSSISKKEFTTVLNLIGETTPVESIIQYHSEEPESHELREASVKLDQGIIDLSIIYFDSLKKSGMTIEVALKNVFNTEPFNLYPELIEYLK